MTHKIRLSDITVDRSLTGWLVLSALVGGYLVTRKYAGYTVKQAKQMFKEETTT